MYLVTKFFPGKTFTKTTTMKTYTIADKEEAEKLIGRKVKIVSRTDGLCSSHSEGDKGYLSDVRNEFFTVRIPNKDITCFYTTAFQLVTKTLQDIEAGDTVMFGVLSSKILARINDVVFLSSFSDENVVVGYKTIYEVEKDGYTLPSEPEAQVEKSVSQIEKEMGMTPGSLRITKDN